MTVATLRTLGGSVVVAIPPMVLESLRLKAGSHVELALMGEQLVLKPTRKRYKLADLLEGLEEGDNLPIDETFENAPTVGKEVL